MNTFYGKPMNELSFNELTLLSIDIQLTSLEKLNVTDQRVLRQSYDIREGFMNRCIEENQNDYSRERFVRDFNGTQPIQLEGVYDHHTEVVNFISLN